MFKRLFLTYIFLSLNSLAQEDGANLYLEKLKKENPKLAAALSIDGVTNIYSQCFQGLSQGANSISSSELMGCVWEGNSSLGISGVSQNSDLKNQVIEAMNESKKSRNIASELSQTQNKSDEIASNRYEEKSSLSAKEKSKSLIALENHLKGQLETALYGERKFENDKNKLIKTERIVDQKTFFDLFESQLGKNVISSLSNYCINAAYVGENQFFIIHKDSIKRDATVEENLKSLDVVADGTLDAAKHWNICIKYVQDHCHQPEKITKQNEKGEFIDEDYLNNTSFKSGISKSCLDSQKKPSSSTAEIEKIEAECEEDIKYTQQRACETVEYISQARRSLEYNKTITAKFKELEVNSPGTVKVYDSSKADKNIDEITTLTSNDLNSKDAKKGEQTAIEAGKMEADEFKECFESGQIKNVEVCKKYLQTNTNERLAELTEMKLNSEASISELEELVKDEENVIKILKEDGYTEDQAKSMAKSEEIKRQITQRYKSKEQGILNSAIEEMEKITSKKNEVIDKDDIEKLQNIEKDLKSKTKEFAQLVHYNNIVAGYLSINSEDKDGKKVSSKNSRSILLELNNNIFNEQNRDVASSMNDSFKTSRKTDDRFKETLEQTGFNPEDVDEKSNNVQLSPADILKELIGVFRPPPTPAKK